MEEKVKRYMVQSYQVVYGNGTRDTVKLATPITVIDIDAYRMELKSRHNALGINLVYTEI